MNAFKVKEDSGVSHMDISMPGPEVTCVVSAQNLLVPLSRRDPALPQAWEVESWNYLVSCSEDHECCWKSVVRIS